MLVVDDSSDEENDDVEKLSAQRPRSISGDDLGDSFSLYEEPGTTKGWVDEILARKEADDSDNEDDDSSEESASANDDGDDEGSDEDDTDGDDDEHEKSTSLKDWEQSDDDNLGTDLEEDEEHGSHDGDDAEIEPISHKKSKKTEPVELRKGDEKSLDGKKKKGNREQHSTQPDIPHIIEAPKSFEEFCAILENCSNENVILVVDRIRKSNAIQLAAENRKKIQV